MSNKKQTLKKITSIAIGSPAALIAGCEVYDGRLWWLPLLGIAIVAIIVRWNHVGEKNIKAIYAKRRGQNL